MRQSRDLARNANPSPRVKSDTKRQRRRPWYRCFLCSSLPAKAKPNDRAVRNGTLSSTRLVVLADTTVSQFSYPDSDVNQEPSFALSDFMTPTISVRFVCVVAGSKCSVELGIH